MAQKISSKDIFQGDLTKDAINQFEDLIKVLDALEKTQKDIIKTTSDQLKVSAKEYDQVKKNEKLIQEFNRSEQALLKTQKEKERLKVDQQKVAQANIKTELDEIRLAEKKEKIENKEKKRLEDLNSEYKKQSKRLNDLRKEYKDLVVSEGKTTKESKKLLKEIKRLDRELKDIDASVGQFQRNVGNYPDTLGDATKSIAGFAAAALSAKGIIDGVTSSLEANEEGSEDLAEATGFLEGVFGKVKNTAASFFVDLKDIASTKGLKNVFDVLSGNPAAIAQNLSGLKRTTGQLDNVIDKLEAAGKANGEYTKSLLLLKDETIPLEKRMEILNGLIAQQNLIAGDSTKSFNEIEEAARRSTELEIERSSIAVQIAQKELDIINERIAAGEKFGENNRALKERQGELEREVIAAQNDLTTATLENEKVIAETKRDRFERELDYAIDAFDGQKTLLERQIADEKTSLADRTILQEKLNSLSESSYNSQTKLLEDYIGQGLDMRELEAIEDEKILRQKLKQYEIDDTVLGRLLEVYRERKMVTQDLADVEKELTDEKIENEKALLDIKNQNAELDEQIEIENIDKQLEAIKEGNDKLTQSELDAKKDASEQLFDEQEKNIDDIYNIRVKGIEEQYAKEIELAGDNEEEIIKLKEERDLEIRKINKERLEEQQELADKELEIQKDLAKKQEEIDKERLEKQKELIATAEELLTSIVSKQTEKRQEAIDKELEANQDRQDQLRELAAKGVQDADNNLAEAERQQAELERQKEEALQRQARIELALSALSTYTAKVQAGDDNALASTIADTQLLLNFVQSLPAFYEGTENTGLGGDVDNKGGFHAILHPNERVMTAEQNKQLDGLSNWELSNLGAMWKSGELMQPTVNTFNTEKLEGKLDQLINKPTYLGRDYDKTERAIIETVIRQGRKERNHRKTGANGIW